MTLDGFEKLEKSATPGPWRLTRQYGVLSIDVTDGNVSPYFEEDDDAQIAAVSRNLAAEVIALVRALDYQITEIGWGLHCRVSDELVLFKKKLSEQ